MSPRLTKAQREVLEALKAARTHLITLGGDSRATVADTGDPYGDEMQAAVLDVVDAAIARAPGPFFTGKQDLQEAGMDAYLKTIIDLLTALTGPSREVDRLLYDIALDGRLAEIWPHWTHAQRADIVPRYTESLDAIVALIEQKLPTGKYSVSVWLHFADEPAKPSGRIWNDDEDYRARGATPAIACCICLLKAMESGQ